MICGETRLIHGSGYSKPAGTFIQAASVGGSLLFLWQNTQY